MWRTGSGDILPLIEVEDLRFTYVDAGSPALDGLDLVVAEGEWVCVVGPNGSGKSTLARLLAGLARPQSAVAARIGDHDLLARQGRLAARRDVGILFQNPDNQIVGSTVEEDLAFGLENLALPAAGIRTRVDEMLLAFDLVELALREPHLLSGGQKQRTALAGVLAIPRRALILDEPTAMLDIAGRAEVSTALARVRDQGMTVVYVTQEMDELRAADRVVALEDGRSVFNGPVASLFADAALLQRLSLGLPPAADMALVLGERGHHFDRLPLTMDELVESLGHIVMSAGEPRLRGAGVSSQRGSAGTEVACEGVTFLYEEGRSRAQALHEVTFCQPGGRATALLGPTGSGKSTLLQVMRGLLDPQAGDVRLDGTGADDPMYEERRREVGLVFQMPELQLFAATACDDVAFGPRHLGWPPAQVDQAVNDALRAVGLPPERFARRHPHSLSGGEQRRLALAGVLAMRPRLLLLDEPFVGLDPRARRELVDVLAALRAEGTGLVLATHDIDLAWLLCDSLLLLDDGRLVAAGPWGFGDGGEEALSAHRLRLPFFVELWKRLGRPLTEAPRSAAEAAETLA